MAVLKAPSSSNRTFIDEFQNGIEAVGPAREAVVAPGEHGLAGAGPALERLAISFSNTSSFRLRAETAATVASFLVVNK